MSTGERVRVWVSGPMLRQKFQVCEPGYISRVCKGACCESVSGIQVVVRSDERTRLRLLGAEIVDRFVTADERGKCPFKCESGLCRIHTVAKPVGCRASPFTFTKNRLLIVRNRYRRLCCYRGEGAVPAYEAHRASLEWLLGKDEAARVSRRVASGERRIESELGTEIFHALVELDQLRRSRLAYRVSV